MVACRLPVARRPVPLWAYFQTPSVLFRFPRWSCRKTHRSSKHALRTVLSSQSPLRCSAGHLQPLWVSTMARWSWTPRRRRRASWAAPSPSWRTVTGGCTVRLVTDGVKPWHLPSRGAAMPHCMLTACSGLALVKCAVCSCAMRHTERHRLCRGTRSGGHRAELGTHRSGSEARQRTAATAVVLECLSHAGGQVRAEREHSG